MRIHPLTTTSLAALALIAAPMPAGAQTEEGQQQILVTGTPAPLPTDLVKGADVKGTIVARNGDRLRVLRNDGSSVVVTLTDMTKISGTKKATPASLLNGLPVTVKTLQSAGDTTGALIVAREVRLSKSDLRVAKMIQNGTSQRFAEQAAATEALRGRMADIDEYNVLQTTNVHFATGRTDLSASDKEQLCAMASQASAQDNALLLVVGFTDSVGNEEYNQVLSERRAGRVVNYLQQQCGWKPYRMLTPTGMSESNPLASNDTVEGKAQNRRVQVSVLVSKAVAGL